MIVLDANAAVAMLRATPEGRALKELMLADERVCAPALFLSELGNTLWQYERKGFYTKSDIDQALRTGLNFVDEFFQMVRCSTKRCPKRYAAIIRCMTCCISSSPGAMPRRSSRLIASSSNSAQTTG